MTPSQAQRSFLSFFAVLLVCDYGAQLVITMRLDELQPFVSIWLGPLDDILYGMCGLQALYYLLDPLGQTRTETTELTTINTVKRCAALLCESVEHRERFVRVFFHSGTGLFLALAAALAALTAMTFAVPGAALVSLRLVLLAHLGYLVPVCAAIACALKLCLGVGLRDLWIKAYLAASGVLLFSAVLDGRLANYLYHCFAALSNLQCWGAALCWLAAGVALSEDATPEKSAL